MKHPTTLAAALALGSALAVAGCFTFDWNYRGGGGGGGGGGGATTGSSSATSSGGAGAGAGGNGGAPGVVTPFFAEGSRLKAEYWDYGGGAKQLIDWFDTKLGLPCNFQPFATGDVACVPAAGSITYFADAQCSEQLVTVFPSSCPAPKYGATSNTARSCATPQSFGTPGNGGYVSIQGAMEPYAGPVYVSTANGCQMQPTQGITFQRVGPPVALASTFVVATKQHVPRGNAGLLEEVYEGSDGSWQINRPYDAVGPCSIRHVGQRYPCLSIYSAYIDSDPLYTDAQCSAMLSPAIAFERVDLCKPPQYIRFVGAGPGGCPQPEVDYEIGMPESVPPLWYFSGGACYAFSSNNVTGLAVGAERPPQAFPLAKLETLGTGRIQASFYGTSPTEALQAPLSFTDTMRGTTCQPVLFDDGVARCIDTTVGGTYYYGDAACTTPVVVYAPNDCAPVPPPTYGYVPSTNPICSVARAHGVAKLVAAPAVAFSKQPTSCQPVTLAPTAQVFELGASISLDRFQKVGLVQY